MLRVSIICPLYNKKKYIKETIDSVIGQTYSNWEMIIVDDGSTDGSYEFVEEYTVNENRICLYRRENFKQNKGGSVCRNIGIELSKGAFILFLDADDLLAESCLATRMKMQAHFPRQDMYIFPQRYFKGNIHNKERRRGWNWLDKVLYKFSKDKKGYFFKRFLKYYLPWTISNVLWRKTALIRIEGFDEQFQRLQDPEIHTKALLQEEVKIKDFLFSQEPDAFIRLDDLRHRDSIGSQKEKYRYFIRSAEQFVAKFRQELREKDRLEYVKYLNVHLILIETIINNTLALCTPGDTVYYNNLIGEIARFRESQNLQMSSSSRAVVNLHRYVVQRKILRKAKIPALINLGFVYFGTLLK